MNYFDNYPYHTLSSELSYIDTYDQVEATITNSLPIYNKVKVLETDSWINTVNYYDKKSRPIYVASENTYLQTIDLISTKYDFSGKVLQTQTVHKKVDQDDLVTIDYFKYDHADRLSEHLQKINNEFPQRIVKNNYDDLGQLDQKIVGNHTTEGYNNAVGINVDTNNVISKTTTDYLYTTSGLTTIGSFEDDGYVEFTVEYFPSKLAAGLTNENTDVSFRSINHSIFLRSEGYIQVSENARIAGPISGFGSYKKGDVFRVERIGYVVYYKKNGVTFYTSERPSFGKAVGDLNLHTHHSKIKDFYIMDNTKGLQNVDYEYNVRGWLKSINNPDDLQDDLFSFKLNYDTPEGLSQALYNGNISETIWNTASIDPTTLESQIKRSYDYSYDALNRIDEGTFEKHGGINNDGYFDVSGIIYDRNGNIKNLNRSGLNDQGQLITNLSLIHI